MTTLSEVSGALRGAYDTLPNRDAITHLAYLLDVDPYGAPCLVVYITTSDERTLDPTDKRAVEAAFRTALSRDVGYSVYFRWQTEMSVSKVGGLWPGAASLLNRIRLSAS